MVVTTKAIVLNTIKYGDSSIILKCYTQLDGIKTYILKGVLKAKKGKFKPAYFQPLNQLSLVAKHNSKGNLNSIKEVAVTNQYNSIFKDIKKQTIVLFLAEMLSNTIKETDQNTALFTYIETALIWLDTNEHAANFHLLFLLKLTKHLGFYPEKPKQDSLFFNLEEGRFSNSKPYKNYVSQQNLEQLIKLFGINFDALDTLQYNGQQRQEILNILIHYFKLHLSEFKKPKSLEILKTVFG